MIEERDDTDPVLVLTDALGKHEQAQPLTERAALRLDDVRDGPQLRRAGAQRALVPGRAQQMDPATLQGSHLLQPRADGLQALACAAKDPASRNRAPWSSRSAHQASKGGSTSRSSPSASRNGSGHDPVRMPQEDGEREDVLGFVQQGVEMALRIDQRRVLAQRLHELPVRGSARPGTRPPERRRRPPAASSRSVGRCR